MINEFYKSLFKEEGSHEPFCLRGKFQALEEKELDLLGSGITDGEVKNVIFNTRSFKAPREDGFKALFYQTQWKLVGSDLCSLIKGLFRHPADIKSLNKTLITLIPKVDEVSVLSQLKLIRLCNVSYKAFTKVLASRLRLVMVKLISPTQRNFVPYIYSRDKILSLHEVIHSLRNRKGKKGWMTIKIDLGKAYDRLNWDFIIDTLKDIGLLVSFIDAVFQCISTPSICVLWKGEAFEEFSPTRGIDHTRGSFVPLSFCSLHAWKD